MVIRLPSQQLFLARRDSPFQPYHYSGVFRFMTGLRRQIGRSCGSRTVQKAVVRTRRREGPRKAGSCRSWHPRQTAAMRRSAGRCAAMIVKDSAGSRLCSWNRR